MFRHRLRLAQVFSVGTAVSTSWLVVAGCFHGVYAHPMSEVTRLVGAIQAGDPHAASQLLPQVYDELRRLAAQKLAREASGQTLQPTALVHEAYLRLVGQGEEQHWDGRGHFFAAAAEAMRRILIDKARRKRRAKHGGGRQRVEFDDATLAEELPFEDLLALDEALTRFAAQEPVKADLVKLRFFAGFSIDEAADLLGISRATAKRYWVYARAWLFNALNE